MPSNQKILHAARNRVTALGNPGESYTKVDMQLMLQALIAKQDATDPLQQFSIPHFNQVPGVILPNVVDITQIGAITRKAGWLSGIFRGEEERPFSQMIRGEIQEWQRANPTLAPDLPGTFGFILDEKNNNHWTSVAVQWNAGTRRYDLYYMDSNLNRGDAEAVDGHNARATALAEAMHRATGLNVEVAPLDDLNYELGVNGDCGPLALLNMEKRMHSPAPVRDAALEARYDAAARGGEREIKAFSKGLRQQMHLLVNYSVDQLENTFFHGSNSQEKKYALDALHSFAGKAKLALEDEEKAKGAADQSKEDSGFGLGGLLLGGSIGALLAGQLSVAMAGMGGLLMMLLRALMETFFPNIHINMPGRMEQSSGPYTNVKEASQALATPGAQVEKLQQQEQSKNCTPGWML